MRLAHLKRSHLRKWAERDEWSETTQNKAIGCIQMVLNHAVEKELIAFNPVKGMKKPPCARRERLPTPEEKKLILSSIKGEFKRCFYALISTGARPGEVAKVTAEMFNERHACWVLPPTEHKTGEQTGKPRVIYLTPAMVKLSKLQARLFPEGPLFRSAKRQKPWTRNAVRCRFRRLREAIPELKGIVAYGMRHGFITEALERGLSDATVAELAGHANTTTIHRYYSHLTEKGDHLRAAVAKAAAAPLGTIPRTRG